MVTRRWLSPCEWSLMDSSFVFKQCSSWLVLFYYEETCQWLTMGQGLPAADTLNTNRADTKRHNSFVKVWKLCTGNGLKGHDEALGTRIVWYLHQLTIVPKNGRSASMSACISLVPHHLIVRKREDPMFSSGSGYLPGLPDGAAGIA